MEIELSEVDGVQIAAIRGDVDNSTSGVVQSQLLPLVQPNALVLLDMSGVTYVSSVGLRVLLLLYRQLDEMGGRVVLCGLPEVVHDTMEITGFLDFFETAAGVPEGLRLIQGAGGH